jgi:hypothetical protein
VAISFKYGAEALALVGIAYGLIKWVGRSLRSVVTDTAQEENRLEAMNAGSRQIAADSLVRQGLVTPEQLATMTPREQEFMVAATSHRLKAARDRGGPRPTPTASATVSGQRTPPLGANPTPPRLHLITPSRPPLGMAVHCPGCGVPVDRDALQRVGTTSCPRCKRPVSAHIQRGRLTVIVDETPEEAEHRRRVEG